MFKKYSAMSMEERDAIVEEMGSTYFKSLCILISSPAMPSTSITLIRDWLSRISC